MVAQNAQILLVDDEEDILSELSEFLEIRGYDHHCAQNTSKALDILLQHKSISILITDILMRGATGTEFIAELEKMGEVQARGMSYIIISGHAAPEDIALLIKAPHIFMRKPIDPHELVKALDIIMAAKAPTA